MTQKYLLTVSVALIGATASFSQTLNSLPSRVLGHPNAEQINNVVTGAPNLVEGREMFQPQGIALDTSASPPIVYVSDTSNNRVLAWKNAASFNNGQFADMVIGQNDPFSTANQGPGGANLVTGFTAPTGMAVDKTGNLYVVDSGNNRILRFPKPFSQNQLTTVKAGVAPQHGVLVGANPDLAIGQPNFSSRTANYAATLSAPLNGQGIETANGNSIFQAGVAFDGSGNLWFTDTGNARVLRFPAPNIPAPNSGGASGGIGADLVIGQPNLTSVYTTTFASLTNAAQIKNQFGSLVALGFDSMGRLFVVDDFGDSGVTSVGRVLVFANPAALQSGNGSADRIMGVVTQGEFTGATATANEFQTFMDTPGGIFFLPDNSVGIVDTGFNRILIFPPYQTWPAESQQYSPFAMSVIGQGASTNFLGYYPNNAQTAAIGGGPTPPANGSTLNGPAAAVFLPSNFDPNGNELFVVDRMNNRVVVLPSSGNTVISTFSAATRVLGQDYTNSNSPNLIEGREFWFGSDAGIALDTTGSTPHLYIADPNNNRVLGYYDARLVAAGKSADLVIGQPDFHTALCNYNPAGASNGVGGDPNVPNNSSLCEPFGLAVDKSGNLYVADARNGRVLRFPPPFAKSTAASPAAPFLQQADLVLGQSNFTTQIRQAGPSTMEAPYGLAFSGTSGLLVSDLSLNRVLYFHFDANGAFAAVADNGKAATSVFGQPNFTSGASGTGLGSFSTPLHLASDGEARFYVADAGNSRVSIFGDPNSPFTNNQAQQTITGLSAARGVAIDQYDNIWIANTNSSDCLEFPPFESLYAGATPTSSVPAASATLALALDQNGALYVADATNRVAIYYPALQALNGANFLTDRTLAPALIASICAPGSNCTTGAMAFGSQTPVTTNSQLPVSTVLGGLQVNFVNGSVSTPAPLFYVSPSQINFYVPSSAPTSGQANIEVVQQSTGQVLAAGLANMSSSSPGIFQLQYTGNSRQAAVLNEDASVNSSSNPAQRGHLIQIFATGYGASIPGLPADGVPSPSSPPIIIPKTLTSVLIGTCILQEGATTPLGCTNQPGDVGTSGSVSSNWIPFTGLAPGEVGVWQVDAQIPMQAVPGAVIIKVLFNGTPSSDPMPAYQTVIYVK